MNVKKLNFNGFYCVSCPNSRSATPFQQCSVLCFLSRMNFEIADQAAGLIRAENVCHERAVLVDDRKFKI